jgi:mono/diheme cytochrome c family protein
VRASILLASCFALVACADPTGPETPISGERLYAQYCARCHAADGGGTPDYPPAAGKLNNRDRIANLSDEQMMGIIRAGRPGPQPGAPPAMPGFADQFTEAKLMVITAYVRSLGNK